MKHSRWISGFVAILTVCLGQPAQTSSAAGQFGPTAEGVPSPADASRVIAVRAGRLFDGKSDRLLEDQVIVIRGDRISEVGPAARVSIPQGTEVIDLGRATVLPGLIDAHTHLFLTGESGGRYDEQLLKESWQYRTIEAVVNARKDLEAGFTTMRDLETEGAMYSDVDVRNAINRGLIPGPRLASRHAGAFRPPAGIPSRATRRKCRCRRVCRSSIPRRRLARRCASKSSTAPT